MTNLTQRAHKHIAVAIGLAFALYLCRLKAQQHFSFQTGAFDLGIQANVAWNTANGYLFWDSVQGLNYLGDHFSPIYLLIAPIYRLWPDAMTLLVIQSIATGLSATALYFLCMRLFKEQWAPVLLVVLFVLNSYVHQVNAYDFHPVALAIPIFLWMLYFIETERYSLAIPLMILAATVEETVIPSLVGVGIYITLFHKRYRLTGLVVTACSLIYFILVIKYFMPFFLQEDRLTHISRFSNLGGATISEILHAILRNPLIPFREMVTPPEKIRSVALLLASVAFLPLFAPRQMLLLVLPVTLMVIGRYEPQWKLSLQYSAPALPFLFFSAAHGLHRLLEISARISKPGWAPHSRAFVGVACVVFGYYANKRANISPLYFDANRTIPVEATSTMLSEVPPAASICATQNIVPHLANRNRASIFGKNASHRGELCNAQYLLIYLDTNDGWVAWPHSVDEYRLAVAELLQSHTYSVVKERDGVVLLKRK